MAQEYQPRRFFRHVPNRLLKRYFTARGVLTEVDFSRLTETQGEPIYVEWLKLDDEVRKPMEQDFQDIDELATEGGSKAILDEADFHGEDMAERFAKLSSFHERAFWILLKRARYWPGALAFRYADAVAPRFWRRRKNLPRKPASVDETSIHEFEQKIGSYFFPTRGAAITAKLTAISVANSITSSPIPGGRPNSPSWGRGKLLHPLML